MLRGKSIDSIYEEYTFYIVLHQIRAIIQYKARITESQTRLITCERTLLRQNAMTL